MHTFVDANGKQRAITLNVYTLEKIRSSVTFRDGSPVDLYAIVGEETPSTLPRIAQDPVVLCQVIHCCLDCDFESFAQAMNGDAIAAASDALREEIITLFPPSRRGAMNLLIEKEKKLEATLQKKILTTLDSGKIDQLIEKQFDAQFGKLLADYDSILDP